MTVQLDRNCQFCTEPTPATWDAKSKMGPWGYMCDNHFKTIAHPAYAASATRLVPETKPMPETPGPVKMGTFEVELDINAGTLTVVNREMKYILHIGGDQLDVCDLDSNQVGGMELPV